MRYRITALIILVFALVALVSGVAHADAGNTSLIVIGPPLAYFYPINPELYYKIEIQDPDGVHKIETFRADTLEREGQSYWLVPSVTIYVKAEVLDGTDPQHAHDHIIQVWDCQSPRTGVAFYISRGNPTNPILTSVITAPVGGYTIPIDVVSVESASSAPYVALASIALVATTATITYAKRVERRKEKQ